MLTLFDLLSALSTGVGLLATGVILCLLSNGTRFVGLARLAWWLLAMFVGLLAFDIAYALGWVAVLAYSLGRRIPGRLCPTVGVTLFLWGLVRRRSTSAAEL